MSDSVNPTNLPQQGSATPREHTTQATPQSTPQPSAARSARLGELLQEARHNKGLELSDVAEVTHVRKEYLKALDEGRYQELPEDVYTRNFVRLYAQAVGLDEAKLLQLYKQERHGSDSMAATASAEASKPAVKASKVAKPGKTASRSERSIGSTSARGPRLGGTIATLVVVVLLVGAAVWGFNQFLFPANPTAAQSQHPVERTSPRDPAAPAGTSTPAESATTQAAAQGSAAVPDTVFLTVVSDPPGAEVSIDNYFAGTTPLLNAPVTPGAERRIMVSHEGYKPVERAFDLTFNRNLSFALEPSDVAPAQVVTTPESTANTGTSEGAEASAAGSTAVAAEGSIALTVTETSWLEAYASTSRGQGQTLVYRTVQPGETFTFELPVYLHVGNAGGLRYSTGGQERGQLGSQGQVVSRAFTE